LQFYCLENFGEWHSRSLVHHRDVRERLSAEDTDGPSFAGDEEPSKMAYDTAANAGLTGRLDGCLLSGCILISGQTRQLPENEKFRHAWLLAASGRLHRGLTLRTDVSAAANIRNRGTYVLGVRISCR
jgi:hypothetical protein